MLRVEIKRAKKGWDVVFCDENGRVADRYQVERIEIKDSAFVEEMVMFLIERAFKEARKNMKGGKPWREENS